jgi:hypothetical protein
MAHPSSKGKRGSNYRRLRRKRGPPMSSARMGRSGHWCVRPIEPSRGVPDRHRGGGSSPTVLRQWARPAEHREKGREQTGARRVRRINPDPPRAEIWRALGVPGLADASGRGPDAVRLVAPEMKAVFVPVLQGIGAKVVYTSRQRVADSPIPFLPGSWSAWRRHCLR